MPKCLEYAKEWGCTETADHGHSECANWSKECCTWWPCSWACEIISWICHATVWIENIVCVGYGWIVTSACLVWDIIVIVIANAISLFESIFGWVLSAVAFVIDLFFLIPGLGNALKVILGTATAIVWTVVSLPDALAGLFGVRPEKRLRVCTVVLSDELGEPIADLAYVRMMLQAAATAFKHEANVRLMPSAPFQFSNGFAGEAEVTDDWIIVDKTPSTKALLDPATGGQGFVKNFGELGSQFEAKASRCCFYGSWRRIVGYGAPVTVFIVRSLERAYGHAQYEAGWVWVQNQGPRNGWPIGLLTCNLRVIAHEVNHVCGHWWHLNAGSNQENLMEVPATETPPTIEAAVARMRLNTFQILLLRASKHVTYI